MLSRVNHICRFLLPQAGLIVVYQSAGHFASWLGLSPNNRVTGGKVISSKNQTSANRAAAALRLAANALAGAEYYESQYQQRALRAAKRRAAKLGYRLVPIPDGEDRALGVPLAAAATAA